MPAPLRPHQSRVGKALRRLRHRQRLHSRKQRGSRNRRKSAAGLARLHRRIRCRRADFLHKVTTDLAKTKSVIVVEDLSVRGMIHNRHLARSIADSGWSEFRRMLEYKTTWYGSRLVVAPRFLASSKTCSGCCAVKGEMPLSERVFRCEACGLEVDRDLNAARNPRRRRREFPGDAKRLWSGRLWPGERPGETGRWEAGISEQETGRFGGREQNAMRRGTARESRADPAGPRWRTDSSPPGYGPGIGAALRDCARTSDA